MECKQDDWTRDSCGNCNNDVVHQLKEKLKVKAQEFYWKEIRARATAD